MDDDIMVKIKDTKREKEGEGEKGEGMEKSRQ